MFTNSNSNNDIEDHNNLISSKWNKTWKVADNTIVVMFFFTEIGKENLKVLFFDVLSLTDAWIAFRQHIFFGNKMSFSEIACEVERNNIILCHQCAKIRENGICEA